MKKRAKNSKAEILIPFDNAIHILRVLPRQFRAWRDEGRFVVRINKNGKDCISQADLKKLAYSDDVHKAAFEAFTIDIATREQDELTGRNAQFLLQNSKTIEKYRGYIKILENIHAIYHNRLDILNTESALVAAYMLYSKVINLLKIACLCLEHRFWYSGVLLRPIDEVIDLAEYFIITEETEQGKKHLKEWFRENKAPSHKICRKAIAKYMSSLIEDETMDAHEELLRDLYGRKSKWIHPTYNGIMEVYRAKTGNKGIIPQGFDYGSCSYLRKLFELTIFFQSSIWTAVQGFFICFHKHMPLTEEDKKTLLSLNRKFGEEADIG